MKKTYIKPTLTKINVEMSQMICGSTTTEQELKNVYIFFEYEDEDEEEKRIHLEDAL